MKAFQRLPVWIYTMCVGIICVVMYVGICVGYRPEPTCLVTGVIFEHCSPALWGWGAVVPGDHIPAEPYQIS